MARPRFIGLLLGLLTLLIYLPVRQHGFIVFDDGDYVWENRTVQSGLTAEGVRWAFTTFHAANWHPLTWLSHMLDCELFGLNAGAHHLVNVLFHAANALLLLLLLHRMTGRLWPAAFVAAVFAWHPLRVESVAWISERKDVLSTLLGCGSLWLYLNFTRRPEVRSTGSSARPRAAWAASKDYWLAWLFFALSLMAKPMLVTLPFVLLLLDYWPLNRVRGAGDPAPGSGGQVSTASLAQLVWEKWPFFLLTIASCVITFLAQRSEAVVSLDHLPLEARWINSVLAYARYLGKMFWPVDLAIIYPFPDAPPTAQAVLAALLLVAVTVAVWRLRRRAAYLLVGWLWFLGTLVPVIGLVQVGGQTMADRYTYFPMIGILIALAFGAWDWAAGRRGRLGLLAAVSGLILISCLAVTARQLTFWKDSETLFAHAIAVTGTNEIAEVNLGVALEHAGRKAEARAHYLNALKISPGRVQTHNDLANLLADAGQPQEALEHYQEALRLKPDAPLAHQNFGTLLADLGRFQEAQSEYSEAARLAPNDPRPYYLMGKASLRQDHGTEAIAHFREALKRDPDDFQSLTYLARVLASAEDGQLRNGVEALKLAERANELTDREQPFVLDALAMAYAECGRFKEAEQAAQAGIDLAANREAPDLVLTLQQRLKLYASGQPVRQTFTNAPARGK